MTRKGAICGTEALREQLEQALRQMLPVDWSVDEVGEWASKEGGGPDILLRIMAPDGASATLLVEAKGSVEPRTLPSVLAQIRRLNDQVHADRSVLLSHFVSPRVREQLAEAGVGWFDATGNMRVEADRPALFVQRAGADRNPFTDPADRRLKSLKGPAAARIVRALCEVELPIGVRNLAEWAGAAAGSASRVLDLVDRDGLVERDTRGHVLRVRKRSLVQRWTQDYGVTSSNETIPLLDPRGVDHAMGAIRDDELHVVTGSAASRSYLPASMVPVAPLTTLVVYTKRTSDLIRRASLRRVDRGANVIAVRPFDDVVMERSRNISGLRCAAPAQAVVDLLTGPGRSREEAEQLLSVLATEDAGWAA